jgi:pyridinium-3,5-biscarboxylic acid mononucleotide synthase
MDQKNLKELLSRIKSGEMTVEAAMERLKILPYEDLDFAKIDTHRALRQGFPEVIFCQGKTVEQVRDIVKRMSEYNHLILAMRANEAQAEAVKKNHPEARYDAMAKAIIVGSIPSPTTKRMILIVSAGTADIPVAEEAAVTAEVMGNRVERLFDAGVAGIHRILINHDRLIQASVIVVVAGMEGALPGVVAGLVGKPVIAVPTSIGYGSNFQGLSALLTMLNSCVPGIGVVNIDNGFGAGYMASLINRLGDSE